MQGDIERVLIPRERIAARVAEMGEQIAEDLRRAVEAEGHDAAERGHVVMLPVLTGALIFTSDLIRNMPLKLSLGMVAVSSYPGKSMESKGASLRSELPKDLSGKHVVVVDDILDTGNTLKLVRDVVAEQSPASVRVCTLLTKRIEGYTAPIEADYSGFDIPDEFVVGYGLDYDGLYRNLPDIAVLRREAL
ncbi:MAG: hypoxanthine phosphoribosyltransferase [Planctomycetota bacterium]